MIGFVKQSTILAAVLLSASVAFAGDLKAVHGGNDNMHPAPQGGHETALTHVTNENAIANITKEKEEKEKLRKLRPAK